MPRTAEVSVTGHLRKMSPDVRPVVEAARRMVMAIAPNANEIPYQSRPPRAASAMWKIARYAIEGANVVGVGTFPKHSTLFFYRGRELDDGTGLLQGSGKDTRFITLRTPADADLPAVRKLVRQAFKLGGGPTTAH
jgi:hypothetical protein